MSDPPRILEDPDWPLIERWKRAHREQEEISQEIFERHWRKVAGLFRRNGHPAERAQELTQETFFRVFNKLGSFRGGALLVVWILLIAKRIHVSEIRRIKARIVEAPLDDLSGDPLQLPADVKTSEQELLKMERTITLHLAITELPPRRRQCIEMYSQDFPIREIAKELGISTGAVKAHLHQARQQLRENLGQPDLRIDIEEDQ